MSSNHRSVVSVHGGGLHCYNGGSCTVQITIANTPKNFKISVTLKKIGFK